MKTERTLQLLEKIFGRYGERQRKKAKEDPEACLLSLLTAIEKELPEVSATLWFTVRSATYDDNVDRAKEKLGKVVQNAG